MQDIVVTVQAPSDDSYAEVLRYFCQSLPKNSEVMPILASMWSYALYNGGLTDKQKKLVDPIIDRLVQNGGVSDAA